MQQMPDSHSDSPVLKKVLTEDGSYTLLDSESGELFHNRAGALTEASHNYLGPSRAMDILAQTRQLHVLDVCFGLGYNSFVLLEHALRDKVRGCITIVAIETDSRVLSLCTEVLNDDRLINVRHLIRKGHLQSGFSFDDGRTSIELQVVRNDFRTVIKDLTVDFDLIFHDPFSPRHAPQLWTIDIFQQYHRLLELRSGAVLTYSSAVAVRSALRMSGFEVRRTTAVGGKSGGSLATLNAGYYSDEYNCFELACQEEARLSTSSAIPYRDSTFLGGSKEVLRTRQQEIWHQKAALEKDSEQTKG